MSRVASLKIFSLRNFQPKYLIFLLLFGICIYYYYLMTREPQLSHSENVVIQFEWPIYWQYFLIKAQKLQLILLDYEALKCIFVKRNQKKKGCAALYSQNFLRFGTLNKNIETFTDILKKEVIQNSNGTLKIHELLPSKDPDTVILHYTSFDNYIIQIIISFIGFPTKIKKNYHLLRGNNITQTIAIQPFKNVIVFIDRFSFLVPEDIDRYLLFYKNGEFHECNSILAEKSAKNSENITRKILPTVAKPLSELVDIFIESGQIPFMAWGTLLGWYRDCGIIKHTQDLDFHILAGEYIDKFEETFLNHSKFPLRHRIAKKEYGLEVTLWMKYDKIKNTSVDFFYLYENDAKTQWSGSIHMKTFERYKNTMPKLKGLCSADLYGYLFFIPCNYLEIIISNYGNGWDSPYKGNKWAHTYKDGKWNDKVFASF